MMDYLYSDYLGLYVTAEFEGDKVKNISMTSKKPDFKPRNSKVIRSLETYLKNGKGNFSGYQFDLEDMTPFQRSVLDTIFGIPAGETMTYGEVAEAVGKPGAARAVGNVMASNPIPLMLPCHRVVATNGLGGFACGLEVKRKLLRLEGAL